MNRRLTRLDERDVNRCARAIEPADLPPTSKPEALKRKIARRVLEEYLGLANEQEHEPCTCPPLPHDRDPHCRRHPSHECGERCAETPFRSLRTISDDVRDGK